MHLRMPSIDRGVQSFLWALVFFLFLYFGMVAIEIAKATALIVSLVALVPDLPARPDARDLTGRGPATCGCGRQARREPAGELRADRLLEPDPRGDAMLGGAEREAMAQQAGWCRPRSSGV